MSIGHELPKLTAIPQPRQRNRLQGMLKIAIALAVIGGAGWAITSGEVSRRMFKQEKPTERFVEVDRGQIGLTIVENGTVESANNAVLRCQVEALVGQMGGTQGGVATSSGSGAQASGSSASTSTQASSSASKTSTSKTSTSKTSTSKTSTSGSTTKSTSSSTTSGSTASTSSSSSSSSTASSSSSSGTSSSGTSSSATSSTGNVKPVIRSFSYVVPAHVPLRPVTQSSGGTMSKKQGGQGGMGGGGGGRGGGGRGGRGGGSMIDDEKPGSTRIVEILAEGTRVKKGDIVCKLDSSAYDDEEKAQQIRYYQAKSYVDQAQAILDVDKITLEEYRDGIFPQDLQLIRQYITTCQLDKDRAERTMLWSRDMLKKGFRTPYQTRADELAFQRAEIALKEALGMRERLVNQTGPKLTKSLEANVKAAMADKLTQDASFSLESQRLTKIRRNIEHCTVRAPRDGIVIYANQTNPWGMVTARIDQGVTLHQDQPIINLPDPQQMRVKASINESKISMIQPGVLAEIRVDAFPDRPMRGRVSEVIPISTPLRGSDVHVYYAFVDILDEIEELRPGLSTEISFQIQQKKTASRVPVESIRWIGERPFVALHAAGSDDSSWTWKPIQVGMSDAVYAEVVSGLQVGDRVVADPSKLPAPDASTPSQAAEQVASSARE